MFCIQCEQTMKTPVGDGCAYSQGMCGKTSEVSDLQDILIYALQGVSFWATQCHQLGFDIHEVDEWSPIAFFSTLTNVNFDADRILAFAHQAQEYKTMLEQKIRSHANTAQYQIPELTAAAQFNLATDKESILKLAPLAAVNRHQDETDPDVMGLRLLCLYGLKGAAAYMEHARVLSQTDKDVYATYHEIMNWLGSDPSDLNKLLDCAMKIGQMNYKVMQLLDLGETKTFGHPEPTQVNTKPVKGKAILVSGHDLHDLEKILQQTQGMDINVYTHGEMLPANAYPQLKKYSNLVGNYGSAWQNQQKEFANFPGPIVMTSNCIIDPNVGQYSDRIFTRSMVGWPGVTHLEGDDFSLVIKSALAHEGFLYDEIEHPITIGFARNALMNAAPAVVKQVKAGNIKHFFLVGGCDGDRAERNYYNDFATQAPEDSLLLTLGCGKYRFNKQEFGDIEGIPRLLDVGQCNDTYSAIQLALALSEAFECGVNDLPLTLVLSWFEQKAIVILLTLFSLNIQGVYTGPTAPAFLTDNLIAILQEKFNFKLTTNASEDLKEICAA